LKVENYKTIIKKPLSYNYEKGSNKFYTITRLNI